MQQKRYRKIPKISPGAYIFQKPFLRGLFLEGLIFGGAYLRREICVSKSIGLAYIWKWIYRFCFVLLRIWEQFSKYKPPGGVYLEGLFNGGFFALPVWGGLYLEELLHGGDYSRNFTVVSLHRRKNFYACSAKNDTWSISGNVIGSEAKIPAKCCWDERSDGSFFWQWQRCNFLPL